MHSYSYICTHVEGGGCHAVYTRSTSATSTLVHGLRMTYAYICTSSDLHAHVNKLKFLYAHTCICIRISLFISTCMLKYMYRLFTNVWRKRSSPTYLVEVVKWQVNRWYVYLYVRVCTYIYMFTWAYEIYIYIHNKVEVVKRTLKNMYICMNIHWYMCTYTWVYIHTHACVCIYKYLYTYIYVYVYTHIYTYMSTCMYLCTNVYTYMFTICMRTNIQNIYVCINWYLYE